MKTAFKYMIFICVFTAMTGFACIKAAAAAVMIESYNKNIASGNVSAGTFREAVAKLCAEKNVNIVFDSSGTEILSLNGISNKNFTVYDCWQGYILRGDTILQSPDILNEEVFSNDTLVVYYGHISDTKIVTGFDFYEQNGKLNFHLSSSSVQWYESDGEWVNGNVTENLGSVKINITDPSGSRKIVQTNNDGRADCTLLSEGVYRFYAECYNLGSYPSIVRTGNNIYFHSLQGGENITRAEACAFLVQAFDLKQGTHKKSFSDIGKNSVYYSEITTAASRNLVSGFENGEFKPDEPINLLQLGIMLSKLYPGGDYTGEPVECLPGWAQDSAHKIMALGLFDDIGYDWLRPVTKEDLSAIFRLVHGTLQHNAAT